MQGDTVVSVSLKASNDKVWYVFILRQCITIGRNLQDDNGKNREEIKNVE